MRFTRTCHLSLNPNIVAMHVLDVKYSTASNFKDSDNITNSKIKVSAPTKKVFVLLKRLLLFNFNMYIFYLEIYLN